MATKPIIKTPPRPITSVKKPVTKPVARPTLTLPKTVAKPVTKPVVKPTIIAKKPVTSVTKPPVITKPVVTPKVVTPTKATTPAKPALIKPTTPTPKPVPLPTPKVTKPTTVTKPPVTSVLTPKTSTSKSALNTVLGAVAGVGTNALLNKLSKGVTPQSGARPSIPLPKPVGGTTPTRSLPSTPAKPPLTTPAVSTPTTTTQDTLPAGMVANENGTYTQTFDDGSTMTFGQDGKVLGSTESTDTSGVQDTTNLNDYSGGLDTSVGGVDNIDPYGIDTNYGGFDFSNIDSTSNEDISLNDQDYEFKNGGFIDLLYKNGGGVKKYADGGDISVIDSVDNGDGTYTQYYSDGSEEIFDNPISNVSYNPDGGTTPILKMGYGSTIDPNSGRTAMSDGTYMEGDELGYQSYYDDQGNFLYTVDPQGQLTAAGNPDTGNYVLYNQDGTSSLYGANNKLINTQPATGGLNSLATPKEKSTPEEQTIVDSIKGALGDGGVAAGAIGALLGQMMSGSDSGGVNQGVDMSQLASSQNYGGGSGLTVGSARGDTAGSPYVPYEQYATWSPEGEQQLYSDLGVSQPEYADGGSTHFTYGTPISARDVLGGMKKGGLSSVHTAHSHHTNPIVNGRIDFRHGSAVNGAGDGQSDDIPAMLADGEYVIDAETVAQIGNGSNKAGAKALDKFREEIRKHKRSAPLDKIPPKTRALTSYLKG